MLELVILTKQTKLVIGPSFSLIKLFNQRSSNVLYGFLSNKKEEKKKSN